MKKKILTAIKYLILVLLPLLTGCKYLEVTLMDKTGMLEALYGFMTMVLIVAYLLIGVYYFYINYRFFKKSLPKVYVFSILEIAIWIRAEYSLFDKYGSNDNMSIAIENYVFLINILFLLLLLVITTIVRLVKKRTINQEHLEEKNHLEKRTLRNILIFSLIPLAVCLIFVFSVKQEGVLIDLMHITLPLMVVYWILGGVYYGIVYSKIMGINKKSIIFSIVSLLASIINCGGCWMLTSDIFSDVEFVLKGFANQILSLFVTWGVIFVIKKTREKKAGKKAEEE